MGKVKSKLGCVSSLFTCFGSNKSKRKKPPTRRRNDDVPESPDETAADGHHDLDNDDDDGHEHHPTATDNGGGGGGDGGVVVCQKKDRGILGNGHSSGSGSNGGMKRVSIQQRGENDSRSANHHKALIPQSPRSDSMRSMGSAVSKQSSVYYDATDGCGNDDDDDDDFDMDVLDNDINNYHHNDSFEDDTTLQIDGQYYFSAMDDPTISQEVFDGIRLYPPLPTTFPDPVPPRSPISMTNIQTLLHDYQHQADNESTKRMNDAAEIASSQAGIALEMQAKRLLSLKDDDALSMEYMDEYTNQLLHELQISNVRERGFPGELSTIELEAVKRFQQELQTRDDKVYHQIVYSFREVESEAYALCRFLRARKFDVDKVFELLDVAKEYFAVAKSNNFYRDLEKDMGVSRSVFLSQYPAVFCGK